MLRPDLSDESDLSTSPEWIYRYIYANKAGGGGLYRHPSGQKPYRKRYASGQERRGQLKDRVSIDERPEPTRKSPKPCIA